VLHAGSSGATVLALQQLTWRAHCLAPGRVLLLVPLVPLLVLLCSGATLR
jgi:hypothetical protein